ncbi:MAG: ATP-dependent helicase [Actinomycetota bacterium]
MLNKLKQAIQDGSVCIVGPPGTGKSRMLVGVLTWLTQEKKVDAGKILVFCFNRRWAKIIREESAASAPKSSLEIPISTFHSFCLDFLRDLKVYGLADNINGNPQNLDEDIIVLNSTQQWNLLAEIMSSLDEKNYPVSTRYVQGSSFTANSYVQEVFDFILRAQESLLTPKVVADRLSPYFSRTLSEIAGIYSRYMKKLGQLGLYNYGLLLQDTARLLGHSNDIREKYRKRYDYVIVDEFQELNRAQLEIVDLVTRDNCIFFGNDDESIYSFRGSMSESFNRVYGRTKNIIRLKHNFRNSRDINKLASNFIAKNKYRMAKKSVSSFSGGEVGVKDFPNMLEEASFVCAKIKELRAGNSKFGEMAIIIKGLGYETHILENALNHNRVPFQRSGSRTVLDNNMVRYMLNFLRLFRRPLAENKDVDSLAESILLSSVLEIDPLYFKKIYREYLADTGFSNILDFLKTRVCGKDKGPQLIKIKRFLQAVEEFEKLRQGDVFDFILNLAKDARVGLAAKKDMDWSGPSDFLASVKAFSEANEDTGIESYLSFLDRMLESNFLEEIEKSTAPASSDSVRLLSFHQCKGHEFEAVFIPFINMEYIPATFHFPQSYDIQLFNYFSQNKKYEREELKERHLEDERRLLYVGLTRAKKYLFVTSNRTRQHSPFFLDLKNTALPVKKKKRRFTPDSSNCWQVRKRALVLSAKKMSGLKYSRYKLKKYIAFLNNYYPPQKWWNNIQFTVNENNPFNVFKQSFSYSALDTYRQCPLRYKFSYYFKAETPESLSLVIGILYHRIIQEFFQQKHYSWEKMEAIIDKLFGQTDFGFRALKEEHRKKALADFKNFYQKLMPPHPASSIIEQQFSFKLGSETIKGRIDQINLISDHEIELIDYKSGSKKYYDRDLREEIQLKVYRMALACSSSLDFLKDKNIRLKYISLSSDNPVAELPPSYYREEDLRMLLGGIIGEIKKENFSPRQEYFSCRNCDFKILCEGFYG